MTFMPQMVGRVANRSSSGAQMIPHRGNKGALLVDGKAISPVIDGAGGVAVVVKRLRSRPAGVAIFPVGGVPE